MSQVDPERAAALGQLMQGEQGQQSSPDDFAVMMAQTHYLLRDDDVTALLKSTTNPHAMRRLLPALSQLLRTSNINNEKQLLEMKLNWAISVRYALFINNDTDTEADMAEFYAWLNFGYAAIEDTRKGWRGNLVTNKIRTYKIEGAQKQGGFFSFLKGGK
jgi:hypothetical protein